MICSPFKFAVAVRGKISSQQLEDEFHRQLYIAAFDVPVRRDAFDGPDETAGNILSSRCDVQVRMVKRVEKLSSELQAVCFI